LLSKHVALKTRAGRSSRPVSLFQQSKAILAVNDDIAGRRVGIKVVVMPRVLAVANDPL